MEVKGCPQARLTVSAVRLSRARDMLELHMID